jgi:hypothetical protein
MAIPIFIILFAHSDRCHSSVTGSDNPSRISRGVSNSELTVIVPIPPRRMESLYIGNDRPRQPRDNRDSLSFDDDVESGVQK